MFDPVCKFLVENHSADFAQWLLGESVSLSSISPSELSLEPIRADAIILLESRGPAANNTILHIEFQTYPEPKIPFRMLDYWVRNHRRNPQRRIRQVVIYLAPSNSDLVYQTRFQQDKTSHEFEVIRLWEQPFESFLSSPGLLPFAILSRVADPVDALRQVATKIRETVNPENQQSIGASTAILAGLVSLDESLIQRIIGMDLLEQSTVYQSIKRAARQEGLQEGRQKGQITLVLRLLNRKVEDFDEELRLQVEKLSSAQLEKLFDALLDFSTKKDLETWLQEQSSEINQNTD